MKTDQVNVRYTVEDVEAAVEFYTKHLGFTAGISAVPAFADVTRGNLRLLLSGRKSSAGRPMRLADAVRYKIDISWQIYGLAFLAALLITLLTVSFQALKAAVQNPVGALKSE